MSPLCTTVLLFALHRDAPLAHGLLGGREARERRGHVELQRTGESGRVITCWVPVLAAGPPFAGPPPVTPVPAAAVEDTVADTLVDTSASTEAITAGETAAVEDTVADTRVDNLADTLAD